MAQDFSIEKLGTKLPPQDIEAEKSLLGSLMLDKDAIVKVADFLHADDFYKKIHQDIYQAIEDLFSKGEPIDLISVASRLREKDKLEEIGGIAYLTELANTVPTASHVSTYARIVQKKRILRDLIQAGEEIALMGYEEEEDADELLDGAEKRIFSITQKNLSQTFLPIRPYLEEAFERIDRISKHKGALRGISTGFKGLDTILSGLQNSDLIILAARPSMGKSSLALDIARNVALKEKKPVGIFSLEMSKDQLIDRLISAESNIDSWKIRQGLLSSEGEDNDFVCIQHALGTLSEAPIYIDDAAQLSRAVEQRTPKIPRLSDLRESGSLEQDADVVLFIYREDVYHEDTPRKGMADIIVAKHRNGPVGKIELFFDKQRASFRNLETGLEFEEGEIAF